MSRTASKKVTHWNYRMFHRQVPDGLGGTEDEFTIREAYYEDGEVTSWSTESATAHGTTKWELMDDACAINRAISSPVIELTPDGNALAESAEKGEEQQ